MSGVGRNPQEAGNRLWSDSQDLKISALVGWTPFDALDIWASYSYSDADKGFSPTAVAGTRVRTTGSGATMVGVDNEPNFSVWQWPYIRRHTVALNDAFKTEQITANVMGYFDKFDNRLNTYPGFGGQNWGQTAWDAYLRGDYSISDYDDWSAGVNIDGSYKFSETHNLSAAFQWRKTDHQVFDSKVNKEAPEHNDDYRAEHDNEDIFFGGLEYTLHLWTPFTAIVGMGADALASPTLWKRNAGGVVTIDTHTDTLVIPQWNVALFYDVTDNHELRLSYAKKNRFPNIFELTSTTGTGTNKPNLGLKPLESHNLEFGYKGYFLERVNVNTSVYFNYMLNQIVQVSLTNDPDGYTTMRDNLDETAFYGFEGAMELYLNDYVQIGGAFGTQFYNAAHSNSNYIILGGMPEFTANAYMVIMPFAGTDTKLFGNIKIIPRFEYVGSRYESSYKKDDAKVLLPSYTLAHLKLSYDITRYASLSFAVNNIFDELYEISQYYPQAGRSFNLTLEGRY